MRAVLALFLVLFALPAFAQASVDAGHTRVSLTAETSRPAPGRSATIGINMAPDPGWHVYWQNPGDTGLETRAVWTLPTGASMSPLRYPVPGTLVVAGLMNHVYDKPATLLADLNLPDGFAPGGAAPVRVKLDWLVCSDTLCVPESATLALDLRAGDGTPDPAAAPHFRAARAALPSQLGEQARYSVNNGKFVLAVPLPDDLDIRAAHFFPLTDGIINYAAPQPVGYADGLLRLETDLAAQAKPATVTGLLRLDLADTAAPLGLLLTANPGPVPAPLPAIAGDLPDMVALPLTLLLAVAGGLLLNIMPCVFPILSLKALSLARSGGTESAARREALAYTAGTVLVCTALGGVILVLRAAGTSVGWAFQLQDPRVIALLLLLMTAIALNLAGLFELNVAGRGAGGNLAAKGGAGGAFWTGALAAFVATPCTGPFMGVALGAALVLPPLAGLAVFAGLGLGLALPFLLLGYVPVLRRRLPKPGAWMDCFRRLLSVPMFLTALALAWVLGRQAGVNGMATGLAGALGVALLLWWLGRRQVDGRRTLMPILLLLSASGATIAAVPSQAPAAAVAPAANGTLAAEPFSEARLDTIRTSGKPVFVYFTADWCITCKVNERGALSDNSVTKAFAAAGVVSLIGDWTNGDQAITRFLEARGRSGVPLYLFYHADGRIEELPQLLTAGRLTGLVSGS